MGLAYANQSASLASSTMTLGTRKNKVSGQLRTGLRDCDATLKNIEKTIDSTIAGSLLFQMQGVQGFARLCPGDSFEISLKYGPGGVSSSSKMCQKWKTRGRVLKDGRQHWESTEALFKASGTDLLTIKARELRSGLSKNVLLGEKLVETRELFSAHPQLMTVALNAVGTLKLHLVVTWNPLHRADSVSNGSATNSIRRTFSTSVASLLSPNSLSGSVSNLSSNARTLPAGLFRASRFTALGGTLPSGVKSPPHNRSPLNLDSSYYTGHGTSRTVSSGFESGSNSSSNGSCGCPTDSALTSPENEQGGGGSNGSTSNSMLRCRQGHNLSSRQLSSSLANLSALVDKRPRSTANSASKQRPMSQDVSLLLSNSSSQFEAFGDRSCQKLSTFQSPTSAVNPLTTSITSMTNGGNVVNNNRNNWLNSFKQTVSRHADIIAEEGELSSARTTPRHKANPSNATDSTTELNKRNQQASKSTLMSSSQDDLDNEPTGRDADDELDVSESDAGLGLQDTLLNLLSSLEDVQGAYSETEQLQSHVTSILRTLRQIRVALDSAPSASELTQANGRSHKRHGSTCSDVSVESALGCFDFLNSETVSHASLGSSSQLGQSQNHGSPSSSSPDRSLAFTASDSGCCPTVSSAVDEATTSFMTNDTVSSPARKVGTTTNGSGVEETPTSCASPSVAMLTTGSEQLDLALTAHLTYCQKLLENLGSFGPLRTREAASLRKLQQQAALLGRLYRLCLNLRDHVQETVSSRDSDILRNQKLRVAYTGKQDRELSTLRDDTRLRKLWDTVCYQHASLSDGDDLVGASQLIVVSSAQFAASVQAYMRSFISPATTNARHPNGSTIGTRDATRRSPITGEQTAAKVSKLIAARVADSSQFEPDALITVLQIWAFFRTCPNSADLESLFETFADEIALLDALGSADAVSVKKTLSRLTRSPTTILREPLFQVALLLLEEDALVARLAETFFVEFAISSMTNNLTANQRQRKDMRRQVRVDYN